MATASLEERIKRLEEINDKQQRELEMNQHEIERLQAARECLNVINKFEFYCEAGCGTDKSWWERVVGLFSKRSDVRSEILNWGVYEGVEGIRRLYWTIHGHDGQPSRPGFLCVNTTTTDVIEVAKDGKTAKMLFISPDIETTDRAYWLWCKLGVDFIKEDGEWKIWHYHVYGIFTCPYDKSWVETADNLEEQAGVIKGGARPREDALNPDRPTTHPLWLWNPNVYNDPVPEPPEPYETFDEKTAY